MWPRRRCTTTDYGNGSSADGTDCTDTATTTANNMDPQIGADRCRYGKDVCRAPAVRRSISVDQSPYRPFALPVAPYYRICGICVICGLCCRWPSLSGGVSARQDPPLRNEPILSEDAGDKERRETALDTTRAKWRARVKMPRHNDLSGRRSRGCRRKRTLIGRRMIASRTPNGPIWRALTQL